MVTRQKTSKKYWIAILVLLIALPVVVSLSYFKNKGQPAGTAVSFGALKQDVPLLANQPTDTQVAKTVPIHHWKSDSGSRVLFVPTESLPIVDIRVAFHAGSAFDKSKPGLANLVISLLEEGTEKFSANDIAEGFESVGARYHVSLDRDKAEISLRSLSEPKYLEQVTNILNQLISRPTFSPESIIRVKQQLKVLKARESQMPDRVADQEFHKLLYGKHPYATPVNGTVEGIDLITREDLQSFHQTYYTTKNATITIVGGIHRDKAKELSNKLLVSLPQDEVLEKTPIVQKLVEAHEARMKFPSKQAHVMIGQPGRIAGDPDQYPLLVGNYILGGGGLVTRLFKEVRDDRGLAYNVYSHFGRLEQPAPFVMALQTKHEQADEALTVLKKTFNQFLQEGPTEEEIVAAKNHLAGSFPLDISSNIKIASMISDIGFYHLPLDHLDKHVTNIQSVTKDMVKDTFQRRLNIDKMALVVIGDSE